MFKRQIVNLLLKYIKIKPDIIESTIEIPPDNKLGDYAFPCFILSKEFKKSPIEIAKALENKIKPTNIIEKVQAFGPYLNFFIKKDLIAELTLKEILKQKNKFGSQKQNKVILIESPGPNTNKPLHLGHLRNMALGISISNILKHMGNKIKNIDIVNDRGIHICKSMLAYKKFGHNKLPNKKSDHFVGDFYVMYSKELPNHPEFEAEIQDMLKKWEEGDKETRKLWKKMNNWALKGFKITYKNFGINIDKAYYESDHYIKGKEIILEAYKKGVFKKDEEGNLYADLGSLGKKILLRADNTSIYITQDIALATIRYKDYNMDKIIYIVGNEQIYHFQALFKIFELLKFPFAKSCYHLAHGMVYLPEGKMKSREGQIVDADDLIDKMISLAEQEVKNRHKKISQQELEKRSKIIGIGAIKFFILKHDPLKDFTYYPEESISFEGETAPYIQYAHARICSILKKTKIPRKSNLSLLKEEKEQVLIKQLSTLPNAIEEAANKYKPFIIANYLVDLTRTFNQFYDMLPILKEQRELKNARIHLIIATKYVLEIGLHLLGIETPSQM